MAENGNPNFVSVSLLELHIGESLPVDVYAFVDGRFLLLRSAGDSVDKELFDRFMIKKVRFLFVLEKDREDYMAWIARADTDEKRIVLKSPDSVRQLIIARHEARRAMFDIFSSESLDEAGQKAMSVSKELAGEIMGKSFAMDILAYLQSFSHGTVDHSVNVSILSVYLALRMGYTNREHLEMLSTGALLHDIGKFHIWMEARENEDVDVDELVKKHPMVGAQFIMNQKEVPKEVGLIVSQHHEYSNGKGYPQGLKNDEIFDLSKIVIIANEFDTLVAIQDRAIPIKQRQKKALEQMGGDEYRPRFDTHKLNRAIEIIEAGI